MATGSTAVVREKRARLRRRIGLIAGPILAIGVYALLGGTAGYAAAGTAAVAVVMATWWTTEAIPIPATALVPLLVFPLFSGTSVSSVASNYGDSVIFLFLGGFLLALAVQRWQLHRRIALSTIRLAGDRPGRIIAAFMTVSAGLSMWVSNTATAVMMLPIGASVAALVVGSEDPGALRRSNFASALLLGIAYAASIGAVGTIIGTPPNTLLVGYLADTFDITIGFGQWMLAGVPIAVGFTAIAWVILTRIVFRPEFGEVAGGRRLVSAELTKLGGWTSAQKRTLVVFLVAVTAWVGVPLLSRGQPPISDAGIAVLIALVLFVVPAGTPAHTRLLDWETAKELPWGVLLLFGGGLALSKQFVESGLVDWIGAQAVALSAVPTIVLILIIVVVVILLTEVMSNTATAATLLPVVGGLALGLQLDPLVLTVPVALAASCAFMLPVATPPNAVAFSTGHVSMGHLIRGGWLLNVTGVVVVTVTTTTLLAWTLGYTVNS